jgi:glycosyltransferase involved in cell wall biosynthesis
LITKQEFDLHNSVDIVIPVLNEEKALPESVNRLHDFLTNTIKSKWRILIADNGSTDTTPQVCKELAKKYKELSYIRIEQRGRGRALRKAWLESGADIVTYMDVDLSTDLRALPALLRAFDEGYHIAIGTRLSSDAKVHLRSIKREFISRTYNLIIKLLFFTRFQDAQCGFKAMTKATAHRIIPTVMDQGWFFDSELLIIADKNGFKIKEVPVTWTDDPDSRVRVINTAWTDLKGLLRLRLWGLPKVRPPDTT